MNVFYRMKKGTEYLNYGREIITGYCEKCAEDFAEGESIRILDLGAGTGVDLINCRKKLVGGVRPESSCGLWKAMHLMWND